MDFDQMLETWRAQDTAPLYGVNHTALRHALQTEEARVRKELRSRRNGLWFCWIFGTGMAVWAAVWIAISITNGWSAIYIIASAASVGLFALAVGALRVGHGREPERNFGNTLQEELRSSLALVDYQLSVTRRWHLFMLGTAALMGGAWLFSWTIMSSQEITGSSFGFWLIFLLIVLGARASLNERDELLKGMPKLEHRQQHLRELLSALEARE